ncbi:1-deoxy-D-xylulose-5-phosphate reductoisomerase [Candidatus Azobacteroides pseudotrichonymphae]|uniref:1-deoxy-D-xylulose 5-phosphate reductoisomerase n=1 Tax=Azobacteroides pseudotrichonymphae genomovar. CFP2 TaxID=511995 RepID=B6YR12_AZOPC|nr:1-deoxy-D-xylulose-5-phosphate reductoisomerase [Candidatus Azobacteroides pseudotrichonymphae]BAG83634.1 1-deoxy-D-xylulose-5-phosphate reductoisomerase [Candidatus Azobacteroides pseudotrichonymphae genomovar. CFP2]
MKQIALLGSTGSIGTQALDIIRQQPEKLGIYALCANNQVELLVQQAREFLPDVAVTANKFKYKQLKEGLKDLPIKIWAGIDAISQIVEAEPIDIVLMALVGYIGLKPTIHALKAGKTIALATKETLVLAGELITQLALKHHATILPIDSEHSAIFQCLIGENPDTVERIILTASGGPFRKYSLEQLQHVTKQKALKHPNWMMGNKITIDSATLMNKGFEVIEAKWLFGVSPEQIQVLIHPQSIIHSMVQFKDTSIKAQLGLPDMHLPIQYALTYPERLNSYFKSLDFDEYSHLTFEKPDTVRFRNLNLAFEAIRQGGNMPCILNASNETVIDAFLQDKISFFAMSDIIEKTMESTAFIASPTYEDLVETDQITRIITSKEIMKRQIE